MATLEQLENAAREVQADLAAEKQRLESAQEALAEKDRAVAKLRLLAWFKENELDDPKLAEYLSVSNGYEPGPIGAKFHIPDHTTITLKARWALVDDMLVPQYQASNVYAWTVDGGGVWPNLGDALVAARSTCERMAREAEEIERQAQERNERRISARARRECLDLARQDLALELVKRYPVLLPALKLFAAYLEREADAEAHTEALENQINEGWSVASNARQNADDQHSADLRTIRDLEHRIWELERED